MTLRRKLYKILHGMNARCHNDKTEEYIYYGARGITVCDEWRLLPNPTNDIVIRDRNVKAINSFVEWGQATWQPELTIDRIDNDGHYTPNNCKWSTDEEQQAKRRKYAKSLSKYKGVSYKKRRNRWSATLTTNGKYICIGEFHYEIEAARAYNTYVLENNLPHLLNIFTTEEDAQVFIQPQRGTSKFMGVCHDSKRSKWIAQTTIKGKHKHIGWYDNEIEAAKSYNKYIIDNHLDKKLNQI